MGVRLLLHGALLLLLGRCGDAQICSGASGHSQCLTGLYCDGSTSTSGNCYTCTFITPENCDALVIAGDCCSDAFLAQCTTNPFNCPPPPAPGPGDPGDEEVSSGNVKAPLTVLPLLVIPRPVLRDCL